jgi:hypothetical protein
MKIWTKFFKVYNQINCLDIKCAVIDCENEGNEIHQIKQL